MRPDPPRKWLPAALRELKLANTVETTAEKDVDKTTAKTAKAAEKVAKAVDMTTAKTAKAAEKVAKTVENTTAKTVKAVDEKAAKKRKRSDTSTDAQAHVVDVTNVPAEMLDADRDKPEQNEPTSSFPSVVQQISRNMARGILPPGMDSDTDMECAQVDRRADDKDVARVYETEPKQVSALTGPPSPLVPIEDASLMASAADVAEAPALAQPAPTSFDDHEAHSIAEFAPRRSRRVRGRGRGTSLRTKAPPQPEHPLCDEGDESQRSGFVYGFDTEQGIAWRRKGKHGLVEPAVKLFAPADRGPWDRAAAEWEDGDTQDVPQLVCRDLKGDDQRIAVGGDEARDEGGGGGAASASGGGGDGDEGVQQGSDGNYGDWALQVRFRPQCGREDLVILFAKSTAGGASARWSTRLCIKISGQITKFDAFNIGNNILQQVVNGDLPLDRKPSDQMLAERNRLMAERTQTHAAAVGAAAMQAAAQNDKGPTAVVEKIDTSIGARGSDSVAVVSSGGRREDETEEDGDESDDGQDEFDIEDEEGEEEEHQGLGSDDEAD